MTTEPIPKLCTKAKRLRAAEKVAKALNHALNEAYHRWHDVEKYAGPYSSERAYEEMEVIDRLNFEWSKKVAAIEAEP